MPVKIWWSSMRRTIADIQQMKQRGERITMLTAYDALIAGLLEDADVALLLVGDSVGNNLLGYTSTIPVTLDDMVRHAAAVTRGTQRALVVADMPFLTYATIEQAVATARRLMQEGGVQAVKPAGGGSRAPSITRPGEGGVPGSYRYRCTAVNRRCPGARSSRCLCTGA